MRIVLFSLKSPKKMYLLLFFFFPAIVSPFFFASMRRRGSSKVNFQRHGRSSVGHNVNADPVGCPPLPPVLVPHIPSLFVGFADGWR